MTDTRELVKNLIDHLEAECRCDPDETCSFCIWADALESLSARLAAAEKDAGRYRWLRDKDTWPEVVDFTKCDNADDVPITLDGPLLDAAIDEAMQHDLQGSSHDPSA